MGLRFVLVRRSVADLIGDPLNERLDSPVGSLGYPPFNLLGCLLASDLHRSLNQFVRIGIGHQDAPLVA